MSGPDAAEEARRYDELVQRIGIALLDTAPQGWSRLDLGAVVTTTSQDCGLVVLMGDGTPVRVAPPVAVAAAFVALRELMYRPERGAWFSARFIMNPPTEYHVYYNFQHEVDWPPAVTDEALRQDLARFTRPPDEVPDWLRRRVGMPPAVPRTEPAGLVEQRDLTRRIGDLLVTRAPSDWDQLRVGYRAAGQDAGLRGQVLGIGGQLRQWQPPAAAAQEFAALRAGMAPPGREPWVDARMIVGFPLRTSMSYAFAGDTGAGPPGTSPPA